MDTPNVARMWSELQNGNRLPHSQMFKSCEGELQELMRQIDAMVQSRKQEWDRDRQVLQAKLDIREQEHRIQRTTLEQKHQEVGQLRSQVETMEKAQQVAAAEYEQQLSGVRQEVDKMKKEYERLQKHYGRRERDSVRDKQKVATVADDNAAEVKRMTVKVDDYRKKSRDWDQQKRELQKHVEGLESQCKTLSEKCDLVQHQSTNYQAQLDRRRDILDTTEVNLRTQITHLEGQLERARDTVNSQDLQLARSKALLDEALDDQKQALAEKEAVENDLRKSHQAARKLEDELCKIQVSSEATQDSLRLTGQEKQLMEKQVIQLEEALQGKDRMLHDLQQGQMDSHEKAGEVTKVKDELQEVRKEAQKFRKTEKRYHQEIKELRSTLDQARDDGKDVKQELSNKIAEMRKLKADMVKLKDSLTLLKDSHTAQVDGMKREVAEVTTDLHHRQHSTTSLNEKVATLETQVREHSDMLERKHAEVQVANAQLDALRAENRHLRKSALTFKGSNDSGVTEAETHLRELQTAYTSSITTLEKQNENLQGSISKMHEQMKEMEQATQYRVQSALHESQHAADRLQQQQQRKMTEVREACEQRVKGLEDKLNATVAEYEGQLDNMQMEMSQMSDELDTQSQSMRRLGLEHQVMSHFVDGVDQIVQCPPKPSGDLLPTSLNNTDSYSYEDEEDFLMDTADSATAKFLAEQEERTRELEQRLDLHIDDLRRATDATVRKYTAR